MNSLPEGMAQIKKDLGEDALILNTKKVKIGGFLGFFKKERLEIIAAIETQKLKQQNQPKRQFNEGTGLNADIGSKAVVNADIPPKSESRANSNVDVRSKSVSNTESSFDNPSKADETLTKELILELKNIKKMMVQVIEEDRLPETLKTINKQLASQEISPEIRSELLAKLMLISGRNAGFTNDQVNALARKEIIKLISAHQSIPEKENHDIICFVGPTGVGKTTTIAKVAAEYILNDDKNVGLITSDTYRIAAVEQLKTYAGILNIPIKIVQSPAEVKHAMDELSSCDIILMDTAGRNYQQKQYINELEMLLSDKQMIQINLVLSLTSKYEDMKKIIHNFNTIPIDQLLLTKKDETSSYGAILNLIHDFSIPLRYITNGQNVPDDIITVTPELIADFLLGEDEND